MKRLVQAVAVIKGDGPTIFSQFGAKPNYTDMQEVSFDTVPRKAR